MPDLQSVGQQTCSDYLLSIPKGCITSFRGKNGMNIKRKLFIASLLVIFISSFWCSSVFAYKVKKTKSGKIIKWNTNAVTYYVNTSGGPPGSLVAIQAAMKTWTDVPRPLFVLSMAAHDKCGTQPG